MARINIEETFFRDATDLAIALGNKMLAYGMALDFIKLAQEKYKHGEFISEEEFKNLGFHEALFFAYAERTSNGIQAKNADKFFSWLKTKVENGRKGGLKGGKSKSTKKTQSLKQYAQNTESEPKANRKRTESEPKASSSSSSSSSTTSKEVVVEQQQPQLKILQELSQEALQSNFMPEIERHLNKILVHFKTPENYKQWLEDLINTNPLANYTKNTYFRRYVTNAILCEIGESYPVRWNK